MCIAIVKPKDATISKQVLETCYENNKDGCGFAYINVDDRGVPRIKIKKSMLFEDFYEKYTKALKYNPNSPFLIHFRIMTHGKKNVENCHPFRVNKKEVFIHNGTISNVGIDPDKSDTRMFNDNVLRVLPKNWNKNSGIKKLVEEFIGYSKLAVLNVDGEVNIYNEDKGEWKDGVWYSNTGYKPKPVYKKTTYPINKTANKTVGRPQIVHQKKHHSESSWTVCAICNQWKRILDLEPYYDYKSHSVKAICLHCSGYTESWRDIDLDTIVSDECFIDYLNKHEHNEDIQDYPLKGEWVNPWGEDEDYEEPTPEDWEDMHEGVFQLTREMQ